MIHDNVPHNLPILAVQNMLRFQQSDSNPFGMTLKVLRMFCRALLTKIVKKCQREYFDNQTFHLERAMLQKVICK